MLRMVLALAISLGTVLVVGASSRPRDESNAAVPLRAVVHINFADLNRHKGGLKNLNNILKAVGDNAELEVVCHSAGIALVVKDQTEYAREVQDLIARGVRFVACENTMREKSIDKDDLLPSVGTVPSGAVEVIRKQQEGLAYFRP